MKLPAPALACGCAACIDRLHKQFAAIVLSQFSLAEEKNAELAAEREAQNRGRIHQLSRSEY